MYIAPNDLVDAFKGQGAAFEALVHDLVRAVGRACGIAPINIDWDFRTNVGAGGRDLLVKVANPTPTAAFIPGKPSIWSIKSGDDGIKPASLKREIRDPKHPKVRAALKWKREGATSRKTPHCE